MPRKKVKVELFGKAGHRETEVTQRGFTTRHVRTRIGNRQSTESTAITHHPQTESPAPVLPAFTAAWKANRQRLIEFLSTDYEPRDLSEGVILHELGEAITVEYAPRAEMTSEQFSALTADFTAEKWDYTHWITALQRKINLKYEGRRSKPITFPDFTPPESVDGDPVTVYFHRDRTKHKIWTGRKASKGFDCYCQAFANQHGSLTTQSQDGQRIQFFIADTERKEYGKQNAEQTLARRAKKESK